LLQVSCKSHNPCGFSGFIHEAIRGMLELSDSLSGATHNQAIDYLHAQHNKWRNQEY